MFWHRADETDIRRDEMKYKYQKLALAVAAAAFISAPVQAADDVYGKFPVTVKDYAGSKTNSVSYTGQIARQVLHDSLKKLAGKGNGKANPKLKAEMMSYYAGKTKGRVIIAPKSKGKFVIKQSGVDQISKKKNLSGKTFKGAISGMPNNMTGPELVKFWIEKASSAQKGADMANGYNYPQLISKFIMGAVFYNQVVDNYLDENLSAKKKPNNKPYKKGAPYTGKEHSWDEAFGYFGIPAHALALSPKQLYAIAKRKGKAVSYADKNGDGKIDLYKEMVFGPAYYAAAYDRSGKTSYAKNITKAFLDGRKLLASAKGTVLSDGQRSQLRKYAAVVESNWQKSLAESVFKYAGSVYKDVKKITATLDKKGATGKAMKKYVKHWGELKGFSLALQTGRTNLGETGVRLNRLIGFGPVMLNSGHVVDIDSKGNYVKGQSSGLKEYMVHMLKVQKLMVDKFDVKARNNDRLASLADMLNKLGSGSAAEND
jgi:hypothetical protein